jgi:DNA-directed RNA polymerase specialized sigma24 family protein
MCVIPTIDLWPRLRRLLQRFAYGDRAEDVVQEATLRLWRRFGAEPPLRDAVQLGRKMVHDLLVDDHRRRRPQLLGDADAGLPSRPPHHAFDSLAALVGDAALVRALGPRALQLLELLLAGERRNRVLAVLLGTSPAAIRRRRARIARILNDHLRRELPAGSGVEDPSERSVDDGFRSSQGGFQCHESKSCPRPCQPAAPPPGDDGPPRSMPE